MRDEEKWILYDTMILFIISVELGVSYNNPNLYANPKPSVHKLRAREQLAA
jgi:hypothetical protein